MSTGCLPRQDSLKDIPNQSTWDWIQLATWSVMALTLAKNTILGLLRLQALCNHASDAGWRRAHRYYVLIGRYVMALIRASVDLVEHGPGHCLPLSLSRQLDVHLVCDKAHPWSWFY